jgi:hypothetical protein
MHLKKKQKSNDCADVLMYISLKANVNEDDDLNFMYFNSTNETVAECTDAIKNFLDNFGFLDDLAPFAAKKYVTT